MAKRKRFTKRERTLIKSIEDVLKPSGCHVSGLGPKAVGVQGDARTYGWAVVLKFPANVSVEEAVELSTQVTNRVRDVTRVVMELP